MNENETVLWAFAGLAFGQTCFLLFVRAAPVIWGRIIYYSSWGLVLGSPAIYWILNDLAQEAAVEISRGQSYVVREMYQSVGMIYASMGTACLSAIGVSGVVMMLLIWNSGGAMNAANAGGHPNAANAGGHPEDPNMSDTQLLRLLVIIVVLGGLGWVALSARLG